MKRPFLYFLQIGGLFPRFFNSHFCENERDFRNVDQQVSGTTVGKNAVKSERQIDKFRGVSLSESCHFGKCAANAGVVCLLGHA